MTVQMVIELGGKQGAQPILQAIESYKPICYSTEMVQVPDITAKGERV